VVSQNVLCERGGHRGFDIREERLLTDRASLKPPISYQVRRKWIFGRFTSRNDDPLGMRFELWIAAVYAPTGLARSGIAYRTTEIKGPMKKVFMRHSRRFRVIAARCLHTLPFFCRFPDAPCRVFREVLSFARVCLEPFHNIVFGRFDRHQTRGKLRLAVLTDTEQGMIPHDSKFSLCHA
jgi:hypothetical protein